MPSFVNLDAQFLHELAEGFERDDLATAARLYAVARNLEALDERLRNLLASSPYEAGKRAALNEIYSRSNIPPEEGEVEMLANRLALPAVKRIPRGVSGTAKPKARTTKQKLADEIASLIEIDL